MEEQLTSRVKEMEYLLLQSNKKVEEVKTPLLMLIKITTKSLWRTRNYLLKSKNLKVFASKCFFILHCNIDVIVIF